MFLRPWLHEATSGNARAARARRPARVGLRQQVAMLRHGDLLLAASFRNYTADVVDAATLAQKQGATVIAVTEAAVSPLVRTAALTLEIGDDPAVPFRTLVAPLCAARALVMTVGCALAGRNARSRAAKKPRKRS
ncbi:MAG: MurR/RpiR family transcriptional regulator [Burkholderiales bacterium]|nr:MurR/RpiR family transcriptional regulator [Burkholderiales bacterium]